MKTWRSGLQIEGVSERAKPRSKTLFQRTGSLEFCIYLAGGVFAHQIVEKHVIFVGGFTGTERLGPRPGLDGVLVGVQRRGQHRGRLGAGGPGWRAVLDRFDACRAAKRVRCEVEQRRIAVMDRKGDRRHQKYPKLQSGRRLYITTASAGSISSQRGRKPMLQPMPHAPDCGVRESFPKVAAQTKSQGPPPSSISPSG